jgi:preprotein translocase subunit SecD
LLGVVLGVLTVAGCTSTTAGHPSTSAGSGSTPPAGEVTLTFRPLVMPPARPPKPGGPGRPLADPFQNLDFPLPLTEAAYNALTPAHRQQLQALLAAFDCTSDQPDGEPQRTTALLACDSRDPAKATMAYLLGPVILSGKDISDATASAPDPATGKSQWTIALNLTSAGAQAWADYTGKHNTGGQNPGGSISSCGPSGTPCAAYVGFTTGGAVLSSPYVMDQINGPATQISGPFTQQSAQELAAALSH